METIFEFHQSYTSMDEDYDNDIVVDKNNIHTSQSATICYQPDTIIKRRDATDDFLVDLKNVLDEYKEIFAEYEPVNDEEWDVCHTLYKLKIYDKRFTYAINYNFFLSNNFQSFYSKIKSVIDFHYPTLLESKKI